jgi:hypothetical protein
VRGDQNPSLSAWTKDEGKVMLHCHVGCDYDDILKGLGANWRDCWPGGEPPGEQRREIRDRKGIVHNTHRRIYDRQTGRKTMPWVKGTPRDSLPLYGSEKLKDVPSGSHVYLTEGEWACDALRKRGTAAAGTVTGESGLPCDDSLIVLRKFHTVLWPDNDDGGRTHMEEIGKRLTALRCEHTLLKWPDAPPKGDADDYFALGGTVEGLEAMIAHDSSRPDPEASDSDE